MKRSLHLLILFLFILGPCVAFGQTVLFTNDLETWNANVPGGFVGTKTTLEADSLLPYTVSAHSPTHAAQLINMEGTTNHKRLTTQPVTVTTGTVYTITFWVRGQGEIRTGLYDQRSTGSGYSPYNAYVTVNSTSWTEVTQTLTCANSTTTAEFILSVRSTVPAGDHIQVDDVTITYGGGSNPSIIISSPANNATLFGSSVDIVFAVANFVVGNPGTGIDGHIHYTVDGGTAVMVYNTNPITLSGLAQGTHEVILQLVDNNHNPLSPNVADTVDFTLDNSPQMTSIYDIQYTTETSGNSPYMNETVTTGGIVTGRHASGYFLQSGSGAWKGVYVYDNQHAPARGDSIIITGVVAEYYNLTEIKSLTAYGVISSGNPEPEPVIGNCQDVNAEQYEGVLVTAYHVTCTNINSGFGMWRIQDNNGDTAKVHNLIFTYVPEFQTMYDITGPIYYSFNEYRIEPRSVDDIVIVTGIEDKEKESSMHVYPNPCRGAFTVDGAAGLQGVVVNALGQTVKSFSLKDQRYIDVSSLKPGLYFVRIPEAGIVERVVVY